MSGAGRPREADPGRITLSHLLDRLGDVLLLGDEGILERGTERHRHAAGSERRGGFLRSPNPSSATRRITSAAKLAIGGPSWTTSSRPVFAHAGEDRSHVQGGEGAGVDHLRLDASGAACSAAASALDTAPPVATTVISEPSRRTRATPSGTSHSPSGTSSCRHVHHAVLEVEHRVVVADRGFQQPLGIVHGGGHHDLDPRGVDEPALEAAASAAPPPRVPAPSWPRTTMGIRDPARRTCSSAGSLVHDLVHGHQGEIHVHDLDDRAAGRSWPPRPPAR